MPYGTKIASQLFPAELQIFRRLSSPQKIQDYLDTLPINFETNGETYMSPRRVIANKTAHCFEGALLAAAVLAFHDQRPLLLDLRTTAEDEDHVVALFRKDNRWGAISKTNHSILRYRDPIYLSPRELAASYFHEYILNDGSKTLREYSAPFDLSRFAPERWITSPDELFWLVTAVDTSRHFPLMPENRNGRTLRKASKIERDELDKTEWEESV